MEETVTLTTAAKMAGKSMTTLRRWALDGMITAEKTEDGQWAFNKDSLRLHLTKVTPNQKLSPQHLAHTDADELTVTLKNTLKIERERNEFLERRLVEKDEEIKKLNAEIKAILTKDDSNLLSRWVKTKVKDLKSNLTF